MSGRSGRQQRTIFILYIPGGGILGTMPAMLMNRLEELTETPLSHLFQVVDGVSTGSILAAGMNIRSSENPRAQSINGHDSFEFFRTLGPKFFPPIPNRLAKMVVANIFNFAHDYADPLRSDRALIKKIRAFCKDMRAAAEGQDLADLNMLEKIATTRWLTKPLKEKALKICEKLTKTENPLMEKAGLVGELLYMRPSSSMLSRVFKNTALSAMGMTMKNWAHDYMFDPAVPLQTFQEIYRNERMSDCLRSTYISAYDIESNRMQTFFCRKKDFFSLDPATPSETSENNPKLWDVVMASIANPFAYPPHTMEDDRIFSDKAMIHTPLASVLDVLKHKPADAQVKLVIFGTGKYISPETDNDGFRTEYAKYGVLGNLMRGREIGELEGYTMSSARHILERELGADNIIEMSPRLSARTEKESKDFPSKNILDASDENMERIIRHGQAYIEEQDEQVRDLAKMLIKNLLATGQINEARCRYVLRKINRDDLPAPASEAPCTGFFRSALQFLGLQALFEASAKERMPEPENRPQPLPDRLLPPDGSPQPAIP